MHPYISNILRECEQLKLNFSYEDHKRKKKKKSNLSFVGKHHSGHILFIYSCHARKIISNYVMQDLNVAGCSGAEKL